MSFFVEILIVLYLIDLDQSLLECLTIFLLMVCEMLCISVFWFSIAIEKIKWVDWIGFVLLNKILMYL